MKNPIRFLRRVAWAEGVSYLALLGVAMPLKYVWDMPMAVKVTGWIHGLLFMVFVAALFESMRVTKLPLRLSALVFIAALLPFGPFIVDRRLAAAEK